MDLHPHGKRVIITGGSRGIGWPAGLRRGGAQAAIVSRDPANLEATRVEFAQRGWPLLTHARDMASGFGCEQAMASLEEQFGAPFLASPGPAT
ncbi:hypothetical protein [Pseudomonas sp. KCJK8993]|uniref:hypothetical protein n=1 Tax=Pseudomonas sp. KCJK8993 TaxID=3344565 RepID=UPI0039068413